MQLFVFGQGFPAEYGELRRDGYAFHPCVTRLEERFECRIVLGDLEECLVVVMAWSVVAFHSRNKVESSSANASTASEGKDFCHWCVWCCKSRRWSMREQSFFNSFAAGHWDIVKNAALPSSTSGSRSHFSVESSAFLFKSFDAGKISHPTIWERLEKLLLNDVGLDPIESRLEDGDVLFFQVLLVGDG